MSYFKNVSNPPEALFFRERIYAIDVIGGAQQQHK